jgi:hypothetical protein
MQSLCMTYVFEKHMCCFSVCLNVELVMTCETCILVLGNWILELILISLKRMQPESVNLLKKMDNRNNTSN